MTLKKNEALIKSRLSEFLDAFSRFESGNIIPSLYHSIGQGNDGMVTELLSCAVKNLPDDALSDYIKPLIENAISKNTLQFAVATYRWKSRRRFKMRVSHINANTDKIVKNLVFIDRLVHVVPDKETFIQLAQPYYEKKLSDIEDIERQDENAQNINNAYIKLFKERVH